MNRSRALLIALGCLLFLPDLLVRDVWPPLEARYAQVAREMNATGDYVVPHINGDPYPDKPPLSFWIGAALRGAGCGRNGGRVASAIFAVATMLATAALARLFFSRTVALMAALILATTVEFVTIARSGVLDTELVFFTTLAIYGYLGGGRRLVLFYAGMALAVLTKGPVGILIPLLFVVAARIAGLRRADGRRHALWGIPLTLAVVAAWVVPACLQGGTVYAEDLLFRQNVHRALNAISHPHPWWWFLPRLPAILFPWILLAIPAVPWAWRRREEPILRALLLWFAFGLFVFSAFAGKRQRYLLPLTPAVALLVARALEYRLLAPTTPVRDLFHRLSRVQHLVFLALGVGLALFAFFGRFAVGPLRPWVADALLPLTAWPRAALVLLPGLALAALGWIGVRAGRRDRHARSIHLLVAEVTLALVAYNLAFVPCVDSYKSPRPAAARLDALGADGVGIYPRIHHGAYNLYSQRLYLTLLKQPGEVGPYLDDAERRIVLMTRGDFEAWKTAGGRLPASAHVRDEVRVNRDMVVLLANFRAE